MPLTSCARAHLIDSYGSRNRALRTSRGDAEYREALRYILLEAEGTSALVEELLSLARADSGRETLRIASVDLSTIVREVSEQWRELMAAWNLAFTCEVTEEEITVLGDHNALQRLLSILLDNAAKYTPVPGAVELRLELGGELAAIRVSDSGIGIALEDQPQIFDRFCRADKARSRNLGVRESASRLHNGLCSNTTEHRAKLPG